MIGRGVTGYAGGAAARYSSTAVTYPQHVRPRLRVPDLSRPSAKALMTPSQLMPHCPRGPRLSVMQPLPTACMLVKDVASWSKAVKKMVKQMVKEVASWSKAIWSKAVKQMVKDVASWSKAIWSKAVKQMVKQMVKDVASWSKAIWSKAVRQMVKGVASWGRRSL
jgi:hypothetical protein